MKYTKPALSFEQQAQRLLDRGLISPDKETLARHLIVLTPPPGMNTLPLVRRSR